MLTRIQNAQSARYRRVDLSLSKLKVEVARLLKKNGYIHDYKVLEHESKLRLYLKYFQNQPAIRELQALSKEARRFMRAHEIPEPRKGDGMALLSTRLGLMTDREARAAKIGGEIVAIVR